MKVIYATMSVVEDDGKGFYSNPIQATYGRYLKPEDELTVICYKKNVEEPKSDAIENKALRFVFVRKISSLKDIVKRTNIYNEKIIKEEVRNADICFVHLPCPHGYQVVKYAKKYNKPCMNVICACTWDEYWNYDWRGKLIAPFAFLKLRYAQAIASYSIYVTNRFLQYRYPTKGQYIGCSNVNIHTGELGVLERRKETIQSRKDSKIIRIGTAAAVDVPYKGQQDVIEALTELKTQGYKYEYHLVGAGDNTKLRKLAEEKGVSNNVFFHGAIPHHDVLSFLDDIDIYIQPSKQEGLPRALIEAMSRGCLCAGYKTAGIPELLDSEYVFPKGSISSMVNMLKNISYNQQMEQADRNFEKAKEYDVDVLNERRAQFIEMFRNSVVK